ncbi:hypothetical protein CR513_55627, partial [Mucuna pruriens]
MSATYDKVTPVPAQQPRHLLDGVLSIEECRLETEKPKVVGGDRLEYQRTPKDLILSVLATQGEPSPPAVAIVMDSGATEAKSLTTKNERYQILAIAGDTSYFVFSCAKSSIDPLHAFDLEIELTLCRIRKNREIIINSGSADSVLNSNLLLTNAIVSSANLFTEPGQMENHDRTLKELATPDVVYQPWCIQYPQLELAQTYELKRRPPEASQRIPCGLFHDEAIGNPKRLHQNEGISILPGWSRKGLAISTANTLQHLGRHEMNLPGEILPNFQHCDHSKRNKWDKATPRRNST